MMIINKEKNRLIVDIYENEYWWGGSADDGTENPFSCESLYERDFSISGGNQTMPVYMSSKGRYIWCEDIFKISIQNGRIVIESEGEITLEQGGKTLKDAYMAAMKKHFPFNGKGLPEIFFRTAQYNTWMEFTYEPTQEKVLEYAHSIVDNGFVPGIMIIDEGWQKDYGEWTFDELKFPNPGKMIEELHELGFIVMLWVCPYVRVSGKEFVLNGMTNIRGTEKKFLRVGDEYENIAIVQWWNGYSAMLDLTKQCDVDFFDNQLQDLMKKYGVDGFKFDGGALTSYNNKSIVNGNLPEDKTSVDLNVAWNNFAQKYTYHECKNTWKGGGQSVIHRLQDKSHDWNNNGINTLIPNTILMGIIGHPFICPDMIGGGSWIHNVEDGFSVDEELFVRMTQTSVFCPMMQFSWAPWRALSKENLEIVKRAAKLHVKVSDEICGLIKNAQITGEPVVRNMEYEYPNRGYEKISDQFMVGHDILVAPVVKKGDVKKNVIFPEGRWVDENGKIYEGGNTITVDAPLNVLPWFRKI